MSTLMAKLNAPGQDKTKQRKILIGCAVLLVVGLAGSKVLGGNDSTSKPKTATKSAGSTTGGQATTAEGTTNGAGGAAGSAPATTIAYAPAARNPFAFGTAAKDAAAAASVRGAIAIAETVLADKGSWNAVTAELLKAGDPTSFALADDAPSTGPTVISWHRSGKVGSEDGIVVAARTTAGHCYLMRHVLTGYTFGTFDVSEARPCVASATPTTWGPTDASWVGA
jgi:hypothetical protein